MIYRVHGSDKSGIFILFFLYDTSQLKTIRFNLIKKRLVEKHTENQFISSDDSLDLEHELLAGLRHGVPVEGPHHLPDLQDLVLALVVKLCSDPQYRNATREIVHRAAGNGAGRPDLLLPHLHEVLLEPILRPLAVVGRVACAPCAGMFPCSHFSCSRKLTRISRSSRSNTFVLTSFYFRKLDSY
jgi:hypothetical protein